MECLRLWCLFSVFIIDTEGTTHWMVTESGLIQPKLDSPFEMDHPYDLLAFLNQETRWDSIINIHNELSEMQKGIDALWADLEKGTDITGLLLADEDCEKAGAWNALDWHTTFMEEGRAKFIHVEEYLLYQLDYRSTDVPDCKKISSLTFSMFSFDHLEGVAQKENITIVPELSLPELISPVMNIDQFGHWLAGILRQNSSSWLHYNLASLYWRVRGNAAKAIECSRRAVHYAPREYKDIALLSMGSILHRGRKTEDAITVLGAAVDHDDTQPKSHFVLATAYAAHGDFNSSLKHLNLSLNLNPTFELARLHRYAVYCQLNLMDALQEAHRLLKKLRTTIKNYSNIEAQWIKVQAAFLKTIKQTKDYDYKKVERNCERMGELTGLDIKSVKKAGDKNSLVKHFLDTSKFNENWSADQGVHALESALSLQKLIRHISEHVELVSDFVVQNEYLKIVDTHAQQGLGQPIPDNKVEGIAITANDDMPKKSPDKQKSHTLTKNDRGMGKFETLKVLYPSTFKVSRNTQDFDKEPDWPSDQFCENAAPNFPENVDAIFPAFLPFENKGIRLQSLLTDKIGVPLDTEHELPWHPPNCPHDKDAAAFTQKKSQKRQLTPDVAPTEHLWNKLLEYVSDGRVELAQHMQAAEIGHRIYTAMQKQLAPKWLLYTLSSLYWRVRENNVNALHCLLTASRTVEARFKDIVLASLASVYLEMGYFDDALATAEEAFRLSLYEPATNFILAELNMLKQHRNTHMFHLKQVVRVQPTYMEGLARNLLNGWACILKQVNAMQDFDIGDGDVCTQAEPGMVCEKDGTNCHMTNIQCYSSHERSGDGSTLARMMHLKDEDPQSTTPESLDLDDNIFDPLISNMPDDWNDKLGHQANYEAMNKLLDKTLKGCGNRGCDNMRAEHFELNEEECLYQHLQLGYWLHIISLRQLLTGSDVNMPLEIISLSPSNKKIPECRISDPSDDFFMERMIKVDTEGWEPILSLMQQFVETFHSYDFVLLGSKIAKYVEAHPESWGGLVAAGWWCGAGGRGACARRCLAAARRAAPPAHSHALTALAALLHMQSKPQDAKEIAYLSFYASPKSKIEAFLVAVSHTHMAEYEQAVWMYRYALTFDDQFLPAKACLHATICLMLFGESARKKPKEN